MNDPGTARGHARLRQAAARRCVASRARSSIASSRPRATRPRPSPRTSPRRSPPARGSRATSPCCARALEPRPGGAGAERARRAASAASACARLYSRSEIQLCLNVLRAIAAPDEGGPLYMILGDPIFGADPVDLARLGERARRTHRPLLVLAEAAARSGEVSEATREAVARFVDLHRRLAASAVRRPTTERALRVRHRERPARPARRRRGARGDRAGAEPEQAVRHRRAHRPAAQGGPRAGVHPAPGSPDPDGRRPRAGGGRHSSPTR